MDYKERLENSPTSDKWKNIGIKHHHGIDIPLFSIRTKNSGGIGEFNDLIPLIDWCAELGLDVIQLLPLNDAGTGHYPYGAISAFATDPIFIHVKNEKLSELNSLPHVDYKQVSHHKYLAFQKMFQDDFAKTSQTSEYKKFVKENSFWLEDYSTFRALKDQYQQKQWEKWPESPSVNNPENVSFYMFLQFLCYQQFQKVKIYASEKNILVKGDLPILISRDSADVWKHPHLFDLNFSAGAPPDAFAAQGQNWGFPLYRWDVLESEGYRWWKERLKQANSFYHLYRIDHIVGFFRIWGIPLEKHATEGFFIPGDENIWIEHGNKIMKMMLEACPMLPIGEDLGTVPLEVREALRNMGICGTKVMRWERDWHGDRRFISGHEYIPESMTTVSTHDSETLTQWWNNNEGDRHDFTAYKRWQYLPYLPREHRQEILKDSHHTNSLFHINLLNEYLALFPELVWDNPDDERINVPSTVGDTNWTYRMRPYLEDLIQHQDLKKAIQEIIQ
jgi:4-alpha-glucanotransferase